MEEQSAFCEEKPEVFIIDYFKRPYLFSFLGVVFWMLQIFMFIALFLFMPNLTIWVVFLVLPLFIVVILLGFGLTIEYIIVIGILVGFFLTILSVFPLMDRFLYRFFIQKAKVILHGNLGDLITIEVADKIILDSKQIKKLNAYNGSRAFPKLKTFVIFFADNSKSHTFAAWDDTNLYCTMAVKSDKLKIRAKANKKAKKSKQS